MRPDIAVPGKSNGVTFSCCLLDGQKEQELMRKHYDKGEWLDYRFDLSAHARKEIILRLQVEPGPRNDASFDFSYFGDAKVTAGTAQNLRRELLARLTSTKAYRATASTEVISLSNRSDQGVTPSNILANKNSIVPVGGGYDLVYEGADARIVYHYETAHWNLG